MQTLAELKQSVDEYAAGCWDERVAAGDLHYIANKIVRYPTKPTLFNQQSVLMELALSDHAYAQFNERVGGPDLRWIGNSENCPPDLEPIILNRLLQKEAAEGREYLMRARGDVFRAVLSNQYSVFDNVKFVELVERGIDTLGADVVAQIHRPSIGDRLRAYILLPQITFSEKYGGLHPGVYIRNSEIGDGSARVTGGLYRSVCTNGIIYGWESGSDIAIKHKWVDGNMLAAMVAGALSEGFKLSEEAAIKFVASESVHIEQQSLRPLIEEWAKKYKLSQKVSDEWQGASVGNAGESGHAKDLRMMDVINGATYVAQRQEDETFAEAIERMAGEILRGVSVSDRDSVLRSDGQVYVQPVFQWA